MPVRSECAPESTSTQPELSGRLACCVVVGALTGAYPAKPFNWGRCDERAPIARISSRLAGSSL